MKCIAVLSGESVELAKAELAASAEKQGAALEFIEALGRLVIFSIRKRISFEDLAMTHEISEHLGELEDIGKIDFSSLKDRPVNVRAVKIPPKLKASGTGAQKLVGGALVNAGCSIDLEQEDNVVTVYMLKERSVLGRLVFSNTQNFVARRAHNRPFHMPVSLHPKVARAMVNLARAKAKDKVIDPFVGTGGVLIEAGLMGCRVYGIDIIPKMVRGTLRNLKHYGVRYPHVEEGDAFGTHRIFPRKFDAVVTDLPYGRSTKRMDIKKLNRDFVRYIPKILKKGKYAVIASSMPSLKPVGDLKFVSKHEVYLHKTLKKHIYVFRLQRKAPKA